MKKTNKSNRVLVSVFCLLLAGFLLAFFVTPKVEFSEKEKKALAPSPKFTTQALADGSFFTGVDSYVSDHFPFREMWIGAAAYGNLLIGRNGANGVYKGKDGWLIAKPFEKNSLQLQKNLMLIRQFCENVDTKIFLMPVPSTGYSMEAQLPPAGHMDYFDDEIYGIIGSELAGQAELVDLRPVLRNEAENGGQVYYKTDHHWTSHGAFLAYQAFLRQAMPTVQVAASNYTIDKIIDFYGTSYAKSGYWLTEADEIELWKNPSLERVQIAITDDDTGSTAVKNSVFDMDYIAQADKYPVFLGGNHSLVKITNPDAATDGKILLVKDSFANCFAPFLAEQYAEVYLVDLRYSRQRAVSDLLIENGIEQILFLYSTEDLTTDNNFMWLK